MVSTTVPASRSVKGTPTEQLMGSMACSIAVHGSGGNGIMPSDDAHQHLAAQRRVISRPSSPAPPAPSSSNGAGALATPAAAGDKAALAVPASQGVQPEQPGPSLRPRHSAPPATSSSSSSSSGNVTAAAPQQPQGLPTDAEASIPATAAAGSAAAVNSNAAAASSTISATLLPPPALALVSSALLASGGGPPGLPSAASNGAGAAAAGASTGITPEAAALASAVAASKLGLADQLRTALANFAGLVNLRDNEGRTCLHYAAGYGNEECVDLLLSKNADTSAQDCNGDVPLHFAAIHGHPMCAYNIGKAGCAACLIKNARGQTPVDVAVACERGEVLNAMLLACAGDTSEVAVRAMRKLLKDGAVPDTWAPNGSSALMLAASVDATPALQVLLEAGASIELQDALGRSALMFAAGNCAHSALVTLLDAGACMALRDRRGRSVLDYAPEQSKVRDTLQARLRALEAVAQQRQHDLLASLMDGPETSSSNGNGTARGAAKGATKGQEPTKGTLGAGPSRTSNSKKGKGGKKAGAAAAPTVAQPLEALCRSAAASIASTPLAAANVTAALLAAPAGCETPAAVAACSEAGTAVGSPPVLPSRAACAALHTTSLLGYEAAVVGALCHMGGVGESVAPQPLHAADGPCICSHAFECDSDIGSCMGGVACEEADPSGWQVVEHKSHSKRSSNLGGHGAPSVTATHSQLHSRCHSNISLASATSVLGFGMTSAVISPKTAALALPGASSARAPRFAGVVAAADLPGSGAADAPRGRMAAGGGSSSSCGYSSSQAVRAASPACSVRHSTASVRSASSGERSRVPAWGVHTSGLLAAGATHSHAAHAGDSMARQGSGHSLSSLGSCDSHAFSHISTSSSYNSRNSGPASVSVVSHASQLATIPSSTKLASLEGSPAAATATATGTAASHGSSSPSARATTTAPSPTAAPAAAAASALPPASITLPAGTSGGSPASPAAPNAWAARKPVIVPPTPTTPPGSVSARSTKAAAAKTPAAAGSPVPAAGAAAAVSANAAGSQGAQQQAAGGASRSWATVATGPSAAAPAQQRSVVASIGSSTAANSPAAQHSSSSAAAARAAPAPQQLQHGMEAAVGGAKPATHEAATSDSSARPAHAAVKACAAACSQADSQGAAACSHGERKRRAGAGAVGKASKDAALPEGSELPAASTDAVPAAGGAGAGAAAAGGTAAPAQQHQQPALEQAASGSSGCEKPASATAQCTHGADACAAAAPAAAAAAELQVESSTVGVQLEQLQAEREALAKRVVELEQLLREAQASSSTERGPQGPDAAQPAAPAAAPAAAAAGEQGAAKAAAGGTHAAASAAAGSSNGNGKQQAGAVGVDSQQAANAPAASASSGGAAAGAAGDVSSTEEQVAQAVYAERMRIVMHLLSVGMTPSALVTLLSPLGSATAGTGSPSASATTPSTTATPGAPAATSPSTTNTNTRMPGDGSKCLDDIAASVPSVKAPTPHTTAAVPPADSTPSPVATAATAGSSSSEDSAAEASCTAAVDAVGKAVVKAVVEPQVGTPVAGLLEERRDSALAPAASPAALPAAAAGASAQESAVTPAAGSVVAPAKEPAAVGAAAAGNGGAGVAAAAAESSACKQAVSSSPGSAVPTMAVKPEAAPAMVQPQPKTAAEAAAAARAAAAAAAAQRQQQAGGNHSAAGTARPAPRTAAEAAAAHAQKRRQEQQQAAAAVSRMSEMDVVQCISQLCRPVAPRAAVLPVSQWDMFRNQSVPGDIASAAPLLDLRALAQVAPAYISLDLPLAAASASQQGPQQLSLPLALATECDCLERAPTLAMMGCGLDSIAAAAVDAGSTGVGSSISLRLPGQAGEELGSTLPDCGDISMALAMSDEEEDELPDLATALAKERGQASSAQASTVPPSNATPLVPPTSSSLRFAGASLPPRPLNGTPRRSFDRPAPPSLYGAAAGIGPDPPPLPTARSTSSAGSAFAFASHTGFGAVSAPVSIPVTPSSAAGDAVAASPQAAASPMWGATPGSEAGAAAGAGAARPSSLASSFEAVHSIWQAPLGSSSLLRSPWGDAAKQQQQQPDAQLQPSGPWDRAGAASMPDSSGIWKPASAAVGGRLRGPSLDGTEPCNSPQPEAGLLAANWGVSDGKASWATGQAARATTSSPGAARAADGSAAAAAAPTIHKPIGAWFASVRSSSTLPAPKPASPVPAREGAPAPLVSVLGFQSQSQSGGSAIVGSPASSTARTVSASASGLSGAHARGALASAVQPLPLAATCSEGGVPTRRGVVSEGLGGGNALSTLDVEVDPTTMLACRSGVVSPFGTSPSVHGLSCSEQPPMLGMAHVEKLLSSRGCSSPRKQPAPSPTRSPGDPHRPESPTRHIPMFQADADPLSNVRDEFAHLSSALSGLKAGLATVSGGFGTQRDQGEGPAPLDAGNGWGWSTVRRSSWAGDGLFTSPAFPSPSSSPPVHFGVFGATASPAETTGQARSRLLSAAWASSGGASEGGSKHSSSGAGPRSGGSAAGSAAGSEMRQGGRQLGNGQAARATGKAGNGRASRQQQQQTNGRPEAHARGCTRSDSLHLPDCL